MSRVSPLLVAFVVLASIAPTLAQVKGGATPGVAIPPQLPPGPRPSPPRDQAPTATGTARIRGIVVASDDGRPLRRVVVRVNALEQREPRSATTDLSGRYEIADLPASGIRAGLYRIL